MAPVEAVQHKSNAVPIAYLAGVSLVSLACLVTITRSLVKLQRSLPVSQRTRAHEARRRKDVYTFAGFAALSFSIYVYSMVEVFLDSYHNFIVADKVAPDLDIWSSFLWYPREDKLNSFHLGNWWDSGGLNNLSNAMFRSHRDFWWFQQQQTATVIWSVFMAIEGRRRNVPRLWAFLPLLMVFGLAFTQNVFFVALLLTPMPYQKPYEALRSTSRSSRRKSRLVTLLDTLHLTPPTKRPATWTPKPEVFLVSTVSGMLYVGALPYVGTGYQTLLVVVRSIVLIMPFAMAHTGLIPDSFGVLHPDIHTAHASSKNVFRRASMLAFVIHAFSTYSAITTNTSYPYRHRLRIFSEEASVTSMISRYGAGVGRVLGALSDSPLVQLIGWDVILCGLSLCAWAGTRGLDVRNMMSTIGLPVETMSSSVSTTTEKMGNLTSSASHKARQVARTAEKTMSDVLPEDDGITRPVTRSVAHSLSPDPVAKRRGRAPKAKTVSGRADDQEEEEAEGEQDDPSYRPSTKTVEDVAEHDEHHESVHAEEAAESTAVAWGVLVLGGLGVGMAGVTGGEML